MIHRPIVILSCFASAALCVAADPPDAVFGRIDAAAKTFRGMTADISTTQHTKIVDDDSVQTGTVKLLRAKTGQTRMLIDLRDPGAQTISLDPHEVRLYNPRTKIVNVLDIADKQSLVNQFMLLGFGADSAELKATYDVTYAGEEKIGKEQASHLVLTPKSADIRRSLKQADLWIGHGGLVAQQKFLYPSGDYKLVTYGNMQLRSSIPDRELELKLPEGAVIQKVEK